MASHQNMSLFRVHPISAFDECTEGRKKPYAPVTNVHHVIPVLLYACLQKLFKTRDPHFTELRPHLFWPDIGVAVFPLVLD